MTTVSELHRKWMKNKKYRKAHEELAPEFALARAVISARVIGGLTQGQFAQRSSRDRLKRHTEIR